MDRSTPEKEHINEVRAPKPLIEFLIRGEVLTPTELEEFVYRYALQPENILNELYYLEEFEEDFTHHLSYLPTLLERSRDTVTNELNAQINPEIPQNIYETSGLANIILATGAERRLDHEHGKYNEVRSQISNFYKGIIDGWIEAQSDLEGEVIMASAYKLLCAAWITDRIECVQTTINSVTSNQRFLAKFHSQLYPVLTEAQEFIEVLLRKESKYKSLVNEEEVDDPASRLLLAVNRNHRYRRTLKKKRFESTKAFDSVSLRLALSIISHEERVSLFAEEGFIDVPPIISKALTVRFIQMGDLLTLKDLFDLMDGSETRSLNNFIWASGVPEYILPRKVKIPPDEISGFRNDPTYSDRFVEYAKAHKESLIALLNRTKEKNGSIGRHRNFARDYTTYLNQIIFRGTYQEKEYQILERRLEVAEYANRIKRFGYEGISYQGDEFSTENGDNQELAALGIEKLTVWFAPWRIPSLKDGYLVKIDLPNLPSQYDHYYYIDSRNRLRLITTNKAENRDDIIVLGNSLVEKQACEREKILHLALEHIAAIKLGKRDERMCAVRSLPTIKEHEIEDGDFQHQIPTQEDLEDLETKKVTKIEPRKKKRRDTSSHLQALPSGVPRKKYTRDEMQNFIDKYRKVGYFYDGDLFGSCMDFINELEAAGVKFASNFIGVNEEGEETIDNLIARLVIEGQTTFVQFLHRLRVAEAKHGEERAVQLFLHNRNNFEFTNTNKVTFIRNEREL